MMFSERMSEASKVTNALAHAFRHAGLINHGQSPDQNAWKLSFNWNAARITTWTDVLLNHCTEPHTRTLVGVSLTTFMARALELSDQMVLVPGTRGFTPYDAFLHEFTFEAPDDHKDHWKRLFHESEAQLAHTITVELVEALKGCFSHLTQNGKPGHGRVCQTCPKQLACVSREGLS